jgi:formylglycine-generating enzyme required for sulfatase activity
LTTGILSCQKDKGVTGVQLNTTELTLILGDSATLSATIQPKDAENQAVSWKSDNPTSVTVDNNGKVTAKKIGSAVITVTTADGNKTANCTVTVALPFDEPEMVFVEGETFMYGFSEEEWDEEWEALNNTLLTRLHYPQRQETVKSFYISKYLVTQKLWKAIMGTLPQSLINDPIGIGDDYPVHSMSFVDVRIFIGKINSITGKKYEMPMSSEWEYAARGGNKGKGYQYSGGNNLDEVAWHAGSSNGSTHPVGEKLPNELGIHDMAGNVYEWIGNCSVGPEDQIRGGCCGSYWRNCCIPYTTSLTRYSPQKYIGVRLVLPITK